MPSLDPTHLGEPLQFFQRRDHDLADSFLTEAHLDGDVMQALPLRLAVESESRGDDDPLAFRKLRQQPLHDLNVMSSLPFVVLGGNTVIDEAAGPEIVFADG